MQSKPYILQEADASCKLVALLNAFIFRFGISPIRYGSKEFRMLVEIGRGVGGPLLSMKEIFTLFGVYKQEPPTSGHDFQGWVKAKVKHHKQPVVFPVVSPAVGGHAILIVGAERNQYHGTLYECANTRLAYNAESVRFMEWRELTHYQMYSSTEGPYAISWNGVDADVSRRLKNPQTYEQAVRDYHHALHLTGYFPKVERKTKRGKGKDSKTKGRRKARTKGRASAR